MSEAVGPTLRTIQSSATVAGTAIVKGTRDAAAVVVPAVQTAAGHIAQGTQSTANSIATGTQSFMREASATITAASLGVPRAAVSGTAQVAAAVSDALP